jgi:hypothetical protein
VEVGGLVGLNVGLKLGFLVGVEVGGLVGFDDGTNVGYSVGAGVGASEGTVMLATFIMKVLNFVKSRDPRPEAGSQPAVASKPCAQQRFAVQWFPPTVTSVTNIL